MTRDYRKGIGGILSLGPEPTKPRIIKSEPDPYEDVFSLDAPVVLTPKETPKIKKERTDKIYRHSMIMKHLTRPPSPYTKEEKKKIIQDHYKKVEEPKKKMSIVRYIDRINSLYNNSEETPENKYPVIPTERFNDRIQKQDRKQKARNITNTNKEKPDGPI